MSIHSKGQRGPEVFSGPSGRGLLPVSSDQVRFAVTRLRQTVKLSELFGFWVAVRGSWSVFVHNPFHRVACPWSHRLQPAWGSVAGTSAAAGSAVLDFGAGRSFPYCRISLWGFSPTPMGKSGVSCKHGLPEPARCA